MINGAETIDKLVAQADEDFKRQYLDRVWAMNKEMMFKELMRVHGESTKMMNAAQEELEHLRLQLASLKH